MVFRPEPLGNPNANPNADSGGSAMGLDDKIRNETEEVAGEVKEGVGKATGDEHLEAEGKGDQVKANLKQAGEKIKDAFRRD